MSRSRKKAIFKEGGQTGMRDILRRKAKRAQKNFLRTNIDAIANGDKVMPLEDEIVNQYDYCDYVSDCEHEQKSKYLSDEQFDKVRKKLSRK